MTFVIPHPAPPNGWRSMSKQYSEDLRTRVIQSYLNGMSKIDIIALFKIGMDTLNRWIRQYL